VSGAPQARSRTTATIAAVAIFIACLFLYQSNGDTYVYTYDSAPNSLMVLNALENHRLDFDNFRGGYLYQLGAGYVFTSDKSGNLVSFFPIGTAILSAPLYAAFDPLIHLQHQPSDITSLSFERYRLHYEKLAANWIAALAAVLMFLCARRLTGLVPALIVTLAFAAGTDMWTVGSQALWQHGAVNLLVLAMTGALLTALDAPRKVPWLLLAGLCAGFLFVVRPTALVFSAAGLAFAAWESRRYALTFVAGAVAGLLPGIIWNEGTFGTLLGAYGQNADAYAFTWPQFSNAFAALLISPGKGLLVFTPIAVFSLIGLWHALRARTPQAWLLVALAVAAFILLLQYSFFTRWWGGTSFGPRYLTDIACVLALLLAYAIPTRPAGRVAFGVLLAASIAIQFVGANGEEFGRWSALPVSVDVQPSRVWSLADSPIQRDVVATLRRYTLATNVVQGGPARSGNGGGP
jgi:hypothetical protein